MIIGRRSWRVASCALLALAGSAAQAEPAKVPIKYAENVTVRAIHFVAAQQSKDALVLVIYGTNTGIRQTALRAAAQARAAGYPLRGVIIGPPRDDARFVVEFYGDAQLVSTFLNPAPGDTAKIINEVIQAYKTVVRPRLTAK